MDSNEDKFFFITGVIFLVVALGLLILSLAGYGIIKQNFIINL